MKLFFELVLIALIPVVFMIFFNILLKHTKFKNLPKIAIQIIIGVVFGIIAILGTERGVPVNDGAATANARDAAPLIAGLIFGGPAGIIAGCIGGIERFISPYIGGQGGLFTQWACSISTVVAGIYAALLRKYFFDNKRPTWGFGFAVALVMEVFHLTMVFITNMDESAKGMNIVKTLGIPFLFANTLAVLICCLITQISERKKIKETKTQKPLSTKIQTWMLITLALTYTISTIFVYAVETKTAYAKAESTLTLNLKDVVNYVRTNSDKHLGDIAEKVKKDYTDCVTAGNSVHDLFEQCLTTYDVSSVDLIQISETPYNPDNPYVGDGSFIHSSGPEPVNFNMNDRTFGDQSYNLHLEMRKTNVTSYVQEFSIRGDQTDPNNITYFKYAAIKVDANSYIAVGIDGDKFFTYIVDLIETITTNRHVGSTGYITIVKANGTIVSKESNDLGAFDGDKILNEVKQNEQDIMHTGTIYDLSVNYVYTYKETFYIVVWIPQKEILDERNSALYINSFVEILVFAVLFILIYALLKRIVVNGMKTINNDLHKIIKGDLDVKVDVQSSIEFSYLSSDINYTVDTLKKYIEEANKRIDEELAFAKTIQLSAMPSTFPAFPDRDEFDIYATMDTAKEVGGDFYDFYIISRNQLAFLIADVSGKGIPAAMFMMESKAMIKNLTKMNASPEKVLTNVNDSLAQNNEANMFVTCWLGILDLSTGHLRYANAGHNNPLIYNKEKNEWSYLSQKKNLVLGAMEGVKYTLQEIDLAPEDRIYLYTDGVTEATRKDNVLYGEDRLLEYLNAHSSETLHDILKGIKSDIDTFVDGADQFDDITMLSVELKKKD